MDLTRDTGLRDTGPSTTSTGSGTLSRVSCLAVIPWKRNSRLINKINLLIYLSSHKQGLPSKSSEQTFQPAPALFSLCDKYGAVASEPPRSVPRRLAWPSKGDDIRHPHRIVSFASASTYWWCRGSSCQSLYDFVMISIIGLSPS